jgi:hypothetical protein
MTLFFGTITLVLVPGKIWKQNRMRRIKVQHKQAAGFLVGLFIVLAILGVLAAVALPHVFDMNYQSVADERNHELLGIQQAVAGMLNRSPAGTLVSIGPIDDLNMVRTCDAEPLELTDFLPPEINPKLDSGYRYSFTAEGLVIQLTD